MNKTLTEPLSFQDHQLQITVALADQRLWVTVEDRVHGRRWPRGPLLGLEVYDRALKRVVAVPTYQVILRSKDGAFVITDPAHGIELLIRLRLEKGELVVTAFPSEIAERDAEMYRLFAIDVLPGLMAVQESGRLFLPLNMGLEVPVVNAPQCTDRFLIYGEQERWELTPSLPVCAAYDELGGWAALVTKGACDAQCRVATDGKGSGQTNFALTLRRYWPDPVDQGDRELRFVPMPPQGDPLAFIARRLRRHIMDDLGKRTLRERAAESPEVAYLLDAYIMKLFHGMQKMGAMAPDGSGEFASYLTFAEAQCWLKKIRAAGVEKVLTQCVGWNTGGHDGLYPTRFPVEERLGGEAAFREMIRTGNEIGFHMQVHDNFIMMAKASPDFVRDLVTIDIHGEPLVHGRWAGGIECSGWPLAYPRERLAGHMEKMKTFGLRGMYYVDYMEQPLEVNYHPQHGGPRGDCARGQMLVIEEARRVFGSCGTEFGFLPVAIPADHIATCGDPWHLTQCQSTWPITGLIQAGKVVPLWQMALSGLVVVEARGGITWRNTMEAVLYGRGPRDEWSARANPMPAIDDARIAAQKAIYDLCVKRFGYLKMLEMTRYAVPAVGVQQTQFADGTQVVADFNREELLVNDKRIERPAVLAG